MLVMKIPLPGVLLVLSMTYGMAITNSTFGIIMAFAEPRAVNSLAKNHKLMHSLEALLEIVGAAIIVIFLSLFLLST